MGDFHQVILVRCGIEGAADNVIRSGEEAGQGLGAAGGGSDNVITGGDRGMGADKDGTLFVAQDLDIDIVLNGGGFIIADAKRDFRIGGGDGDVIGVGAEFDQDIAERLDGINFFCDAAIAMDALGDVGETNEMAASESRHQFMD